MKVDVKVTGIPELMARLRHYSEIVPDKARKTMHRGAAKVVKEAKLNVPVDKHNLEESIRSEVKYEFRGRLTIEILTGGYVGTVNVEEYAMKVHENYNDDTPGKHTIAKRAANPGRYIGRKFLERALDSQATKLHASMVEAVDEALAS